MCCDVTMCHHQVVLVYLTCSFYFLALFREFERPCGAVTIDSYLAVELMVLLIVGRRLKTSPCSGLVIVGMLLKQAPIEVAIGAVSA